MLIAFYMKLKILFNSNQRGEREEREMVVFWLNVKFECIVDFLSCSPYRRGEFVALVFLHCLWMGH